MGSGEADERLLGRDGVDSHGDGIPDWFEEKMGCDVSWSDAVVERSGYMRLEEWANSLV